VAHRGEGLEIAPGTAPQVEDREGRRRSDVPQQRRDVLRDVVAARAFPELIRAPVVVIERAGGDLLQVLGFELHVIRIMAGRLRHAYIPV
jgi:hypothetical protein